jgi:hypothetical protein
MLFLLLVCGFSSAIKAEDTFDPETSILTLDSVTIPGDRIYKNVVVHINQFTILGVGGSIPNPDDISETCTCENFSMDKFNTIQPGMTLDQVTQVIGCKFNPKDTMYIGGLTRYQWADYPRYQWNINVFFFGSSGRVIDGSEAYKSGRLCSQ